MTSSTDKLTTTSDPLLFEQESSLQPSAPDASGPWKILIVDDEADIHQVTTLALRSIEILGRPLQFLHAYTGAESVEQMRQHPDVALILMDVVMESDHAGLDAVDAIRNELANRRVRIVLRTGQPGVAPAHEVVTRYDINDYKEKSELTVTRLFTTVYTSLCLYEKLERLEQDKLDLTGLAMTAAAFYGHTRPDQLTGDIITQLPLLLERALSPAPVVEGTIAITAAESALPVVLAGTGCYEGLTGQPLEDASLRLIVDRDDLGGSRLMGRYFVHSQISHGTVETLFVARLQSDASIIRNTELLEVFFHNAASALQSTALTAEISRTQHELVHMLSEAIEWRSRETGNHVRRVAEYCYLLGKLSGLPESQADLLKRAAPLHDAGKIAIPDSILNKPGKHTEEEFSIMKTHAEIGQRMLQNQDLPVLRAGAVIAGQHHERWDGLGYPNRFQGEAIHIFGRIAALTYVFDALGSDRCYKKAWPLEKILELLNAERGRHFDPTLVDLFLGNLERFIEIRDRYPDEAAAY